MFKWLPSVSLAWILHEKPVFWNTRNVFHLFGGFWLYRSPFEGERLIDIKLRLCLNGFVVEPRRFHFEARLRLSAFFKGCLTCEERRERVYTPCLSVFW